MYHYLIMYNEFMRESILPESLKKHLNLDQLEMGEFYIPVSIGDLSDGFRFYGLTSNGKEILLHTERYGVQYFSLEFLKSEKFIKYI